ncbi:MAG TPA: MFS transporter [Methylomirabilota bacterium]|nr:MFS transporter [Methylomirabilota bacterium]
MRVVPVRPASPWLVVVTVWLTLGVTFGLMFSFSVFLVPLLEEFGWSRGLAAGAFSLSAVVQGLLSPAIGALVDRFGARRLILGGVVALGVSCLLGSRIAAVWHLYLVTGVVTAVAISSVGWVPTAALVAQWFATRQATMMGLAFSGMGVGVLTIGPLAQWLISAYGWRDAYRWLGVGTLLLLVPLVWWGAQEAPRAAPSKTASTGTPVDDGGIRVRAALRTRAFWALFLAYMCTPLAVFTVVTHQVAFAVDHGFPRLFVASIFGLTGFMSIAGRVLFGFAADRIGRALSATISYACTALGTLALLSIEPWRHVAGLYAYAALFGLGFGARGPIITAIAAARFPGRRFGAIYGFMSIGNGLGGALGPWFAGAVFDVTGSYRIPFLVATLFCVAGSICFWLAEPRGPTAGTR